MLKLHKYILIVTFLMGLQMTYGQQLPSTTQYLVNPYALSPTLAGYTGYSEVAINYRNDWTGIDGSPRTFSANGFGNVYKEKLWLGGELMTDKTDILSVFKANLSLTYKLQVDNDQFLYFGIWTTLFQASVNTGNGIGVDPNDPLIQNSSKLNSSAFNAGFGINYNWNNFNLGFSMPASFGSNDEYVTDASFKYKVQRQFQVHASYMFNFSDKWQLQTIGVYRKTGNMPATFELSAMSIYQGRFWGGMLYRNSGVLAINVGAHIYNGFIFNYSYEIGMGSINKGSGGSHEITLGYRFKFKEDNYFNAEGNTSSKGKRRKSSSTNYPEVQDYNYKRR